MIKLASPDISESDILRVADVIKSGSLIQGVNVVEFETLLSNFTGIPFSAVLS